jgi:hypothetical protein
MDQSTLKGAHMKIVCLSRQIGSYGDEIAAIVSEKLGLHLIDQTEIRRLAENFPRPRKKVALFLGFLS